MEETMQTQTSQFAADCLIAGLGYGGVSAMPSTSWVRALATDTLSSDRAQWV